ncbi:hypothetical protein B0H13DRAFT_2356706 [Mycena leptocephala]|nr:hypothetical protein B0H13DRAFT_2356706 [Mycena leptocephala]
MNLSGASNAVLQILLGGRGIRHLSLQPRSSASNIFVLVAYPLLTFLARRAGSDRGARVPAQPLLHFDSGISGMSSNIVVSRCIL